MIGLEWIVARHPEMGQLVTGTPFYAITAERYIVPLVIYYTFTDEQVELMSVIKSQPAL